MGVGTNTTYFVSSHYEIVESYTGTQVNKYYGVYPEPSRRAGSQRIAMRTNGTLNFLLGDHLGSTSLTTDATGTVVSELRYKAWGETRYASGTTSTKYQYTGQYSYAADFGLHFYNARWYDSSLSRFAQADSIIPAGIQGLDRYAYTNNAPINYVDPSGHTSVCVGPNADPECFRPDPWQSSSSTNYMFTWLPVDAENIQWIQPYGNSVEAWNIASYNGHNYCGYAQCLHAGIDLGAAAGTPVYAGVYGTWWGSCSKDCSYPPGWVTILTIDGYIVRYGHIKPVGAIKGPITPDTIIGYIADQGGNSHVHVEVSKNGKYYNPTVLMSPKVRGQYLNHVVENDFHEIPEYPSLWDSPLDQPIIDSHGNPVWSILGICKDKGKGDVTIEGVKYEDRHLGVDC